jgi:protein-S-isoprenylcysteine O-methyltransferase Ste14
MTRAMYLVFGVLAYVLFFATFLYLVAFVGDLPLVSYTVDRGGDVGSWPIAIAVDLILVALFGLQHSVMARPAFKRRWTRIVPEPIERSIFVVSASLMLILMFVLWRPIPAPVWTITNGVAADAIWALFGLGWLIVLLSTFLINHFELFGLSQVWGHARGKPAAEAMFRTPLLYKVVRHPLYSGFILAFFASPIMSAGHLLLATAMLGYIVIAIGHEERDLVAMFGDRYVEYRGRVGMLVPRRTR